MFFKYLLILSLVILIYCIFLYNYLIKKYSNNYDNFIKILKNVKNNDMYFMNFGYWKEKCLSLKCLFSKCLLRIGKSLISFSISNG